MTWRTSNLEYYTHYWGTALGYGPDQARSKMRAMRQDVRGVWGQSDDPLATHTPMAQNAILERLARLAAGRIDDWESLVDPKLSPGENYAILLEHGGELPVDEKEKIQREIAATIDDQERSRAVDILYDNVESIDDGEMQDVVDDIATEYGQEFVDETLEAARIHAYPEETDELVVTANDVDESPTEVTTTTEAETAEMAVEKAEFVRSVETPSPKPTPQPEPTPEPVETASSPGLLTRLKDTIRTNLDKLPPVIQDVAAPLVLDDDDLHRYVMTMEHGGRPQATQRTLMEY